MRTIYTLALCLLCLQGKAQNQQDTATLQWLIRKQMSEGSLDSAESFLSDYHQIKSDSGLIVEHHIRKSDTIKKTDRIPVKWVVGFYGTGELKVFPAKYLIHSYHETRVSEWHLFNTEYKRWAHHWRILGMPVDAMQDLIGIYEYCDTEDQLSRIEWTPGPQNKAIKYGDKKIQ